MALGDRTLGINAFRYWYSLSGLQTKGITFDMAVEHYDTRSPTFFDGLGGAIRVGSVSESKMKRAMEAIASGGFGLYPHISAFFDSLASEVMRFRYEDAATVVADSVSDIKKVALGGAAIYLLGFGIVAAILLYRGRP